MSGTMAVVNNVQMLCRFAIVPANEADVAVGRCLLNANEDELDRAGLGGQATQARQVLLWGQEGVFGDGDFHTITGEWKETTTVDSIDGRSMKAD